MKEDSTIVEYGLSPEESKTSYFKVLGKMRRAYEYKQIYEFKCLLEEKKFSEHSLFYRRDGQLSLFETILQSRDEGSSQFISLIYVACKLWEEDSILNQQNSSEKSPIEFIIESNSNENLFCFLIFDIAVQCVKRTPASNQYQLKMKNEQLIDRKGFSIFNKIFRIVDLNNLKKCLIVLEELLMEMKEITDIKKETDVDHLLKNVKDEEIKESLLKLILKYWKIESADYGQYHQTFEDISPYYHLYFSLKENNEQEFQKSFPNYLAFMKLNHSKDYKKHLVEDCNYLLFAASQGNHEKAIKLVVGCYTNDKDLNEGYIQFMIKMIGDGFYLGRGINQEAKVEDRIEPDVLEQFLNSCVSSTTDKNGEKVLKIDYTCFVDPEIRDANLKSLKDEPALLLFNKSLSPVSMILDNDKLTHLITHPMVGLFATLKDKKFQMIRIINLLTFLIFFMVPFLILFINKDINEAACLNSNKTLVGEISKSDNETLTTWDFVFLFVSIIYLTARELIQFLIADSKLGYFKKKSNLLELGLIISGLSVVLLSDYYRVSSAFVILIASVEILMLLPISTVSTYMYMLKTVSETFIKFFRTFLLIILAFTFSFYSLFRPIATTNYEYNRSSGNTRVNHINDQCINKTENMNFGDVGNSFLKTTLMLAGHITLEPRMEFSIWDKIIFFIFLITAMVLLNLINGLAISDIQELKNNALYLNIKRMIRTAEESENFMCNLYWKARLGSYTPDELLMYHIDLNQRNFWKWFLMRFAVIIVRCFPHLHKMNNLVIDHKLQNVAYCTHNQYLHPILSTINGGSKKFSIEIEDFEKFIEIIKKREARNAAIDEEELVKLRTEKNEQEIVNLNVKLESMQELLMGYITNGFMEVNANISKLVEQPKSE